jgi:hypothetical protein
VDEAKGFFVRDFLVTMTLAFLGSGQPQAMSIFPPGSILQFFDHRPGLQEISVGMLQKVKIVWITRAGREVVEFRDIIRPLLYKDVPIYSDTRGLLEFLFLDTLSENFQGDFLCANPFLLCDGGDSIREFRIDLQKVPVEFF